RLKEAGYDVVRNPDDKHDGQWKIAGKRQTVYALRELSIRDQIEAARALGRPPQTPPLPVVIGGVGGVGGFPLPS
ncbi:MAG TPA: hypothetical protein VN749_13225, partial [Candidatus Eisenbacteria bacterium]|nr:hypothetical protein [Candidatus Eisenbacteria bacterium]